MRLQLGIAGLVLVTGSRTAESIPLHPLFAVQDEIFIAAIAWLQRIDTRPQLHCSRRAGFYQLGCTTSSADDDLVLFYYLDGVEAMLRGQATQVLVVAGGSMFTAETVRLS